jgi:AraC-like DNA-binding protein
MQILTESNIPVYTLEESGWDGVKDFEIAECKGLTRQQKDYFFVPHRNDFYKLILVREGDSRHWVDMVPFTIKPDAFYFSSPQHVMLKEESAGNSVVSICFTDEFLELEENRMLRKLPIIQNLQNEHELILSDFDLDFINDIIKKLLVEYKYENGWRNSMLSAYLQVMLIHLSRLYTTQFSNNDASSNRALLKRFQALITENYNRVHDVAGYASMVNLSSGHFSELIKEQSGKTAIQHIHDRLLLEAKRMLFHTDTSVKEIAFTLGFEDASYFNRFFKKFMASTPVEYRTAIREMYH